MTDRDFAPDAIFAALASHQVDFVVIGGLAARAHGAGWNTFDADVVVSTDDDNLLRLAAALAELEAIYYLPDRRRIEPDIRKLRSIPGPQLMETKFGRLDVLKDAGGETYASLVSEAHTSVEQGQELKVASVSALLRMKRAANRPKDQEGIAALEALVESERKSEDQ